MFQNKGFTMIEMLFVLSIIVSITLLTIPYYFTHQNNYNFENVQKQIGMMIDQAKQESLISHQRIDLCFTKKEVYYLKDEQKISFQLPDKFYFDKIVLLVSLYTLNGKTMLRIEKEYQEYISIQSNQEQKLNLEEGIEQCLKEALH